MISWPSTVTLPCARHQDAADDADQRRLAGAVGAEQREDLAATDIEIDSLKRLEPGRVALRKVFDGNDRLHGKEVEERSQPPYRPQNAIAPAF